MTGGWLLGSSTPRLAGRGWRLRAPSYYLERFKIRRLPAPSTSMRRAPMRAEHARASSGGAGRVGPVVVAFGRPPLSLSS
jgi:hypothetical protein